MRVLFNFTVFKEIWYSIAVLMAILIIGTEGYVLIEGFGYLDAFYMTVITVSTVGFGEVHQLSAEGRLFTALLIIFTFGVFAYAVSSITRYLVSGEYKIYIKNYRSLKKLEGLNNHVIVCGYGRNGVQAVKTLDAHGTPYAVIESDSKLVEKIQEKRPNVLIVEGDATDETMIERAGVEHARALIATLPSDADNLFVVLTARELNKKMTIISRASDDRSEKKLKIAGANNVILPDKVGGSHMATLVLTPDLMEFLDHISLIGQDQTSLVELEVRATKEHRKRSIRELEVQRQTGARIIGVKMENNEIIVNPAADMSLEPGAKLFVLGTSTQVEKLRSALHE